jgi:hypothetical protein
MIRGVEQAGRATCSTLHIKGIHTKGEGVRMRTKCQSGIVLSGGNILSNVEEDGEGGL